MPGPFKIHRGAGTYKDIVWWTCELREPIGGYTHVYCMPYAITEEMVAEVSLSSCSRDAVTPDLDKRGTGNIHPSINDVAEANKDLKIRQLVLCTWHKDIKQFGPALTAGMTCDGTLIHYSNADVPAANYYPLIIPTTNLPEENKRQLLLRNVAATCRSFRLPIDDSLVEGNENPDWMLEDLISFRKNKRTDKIYWVDYYPPKIGPMDFTFDKKKIYNLYADYPHNLSPEEKAIFDAENPYWVNFFADRQPDNKNK